MLYILKLTMRESKICKKRHLVLEVVSFLTSILKD